MLRTLTLAGGYEIRTYIGWCDLGRADMESAPTLAGATLGGRIWNPPLQQLVEPMGLNPSHP